MTNDQSFVDYPAFFCVLHDAALTRERERERDVKKRGGQKNCVRRYLKGDFLKFVSNAHARARAQSSIRNEAATR